MSIRTLLICIKLLVKRLSISNVVCLTILWFCIANLDKKSRKVYYQDKFRKSKIDRISVCIEIKRYDCARLNDTFCAKLNAFYSLIKGTSERSIEDEEFDDFFQFQPTFRRSSSYVTFNHLCFKYVNDRDTQTTVMFDNRAKVTVHIFINDELNDRRRFGNEYFKYTCSDFVRCDGYLVTGKLVGLERQNQLSFF